MGTGLILLLICLLILVWQLKKNHENRSILVLSLASLMGLLGLWYLFDWVIIHTWL
ncbi:hypothetical protein [Jeotgalibacillus soli]|uniref:Uncharacterized protein n=1 Tax=Jeotgalibacillus soli TaxID=889306 RepID=A0A0C2V8R3_9BACL|nr:hypothetical protein [Jeotgalibacillus soli]KIL45352.1 hypothetical protein KP78_28960 [Jeotgalibacillus soli]